MKQYITPKQYFAFSRELDDAELFDQIDYLDSLWEPAVGGMCVIELWRKERHPAVISKVFSDPRLFLCYDLRRETYTSYSKNESTPLFSVAQMINVLGTPDMKYDNENGVWSVFIDGQKYSKSSLCDALWDAVKDKVKRSVA